MPSSGENKWTWGSFYIFFFRSSEGDREHVVLDVIVKTATQKHSTTKSAFRHPVRDNQHLNTALMTRYIEQIKQARYDNLFNH